MRRSNLPTGSCSAQQNKGLHRLTGPLFHDVGPLFGKMLLCVPNKDSQASERHLAGHGDVAIRSYTIIRNFGGMPTTGCMPNLDLLWAQPKNPTACGCNHLRNIAESSVRRGNKKTAGRRSVEQTTWLNGQGRGLETPSWVPGVRPVRPSRFDSYRRLSFTCITGGSSVGGPQKPKRAPGFVTWRSGVQVPSAGPPFRGGSFQIRPFFFLGPGIGLLPLVPVNTGQTYSWGQSMCMPTVCQLAYTLPPHAARQTLRPEELSTPPASSRLHPASEGTGSIRDEGSRYRARPDSEGNGRTESEPIHQESPGRPRASEEQQVSHGGKYAADARARW